MPIAPPPRDDKGCVIPHDHREIMPGDGIIRRVSEHHVVTDVKVPGGKKIASIAFKASEGQNAGMSVDLQKLIEEAGLDAKKYVTTPRWIGSVRFTAEQLRAESFQVGFDPLEKKSTQDANPYHGEVWGNFSKGNQKKLRAMCEWFVKIADVSI